MQCQNCTQDTPANMSYCVHCGSALNLSFEEVQGLMVDQIQFEREESTEAQLRQFLMATIFVILMTSIWNGLYQDPKTCHVVPLYSESIVIGEKLVVPGGIEFIRPIIKNDAIKRPE